MRHAWTAGAILCAVVGFLVAVPGDSRAEDQSPAGQNVVGEDALEDLATDDDALYGDAYEEDVDEWGDYPEEGYDYDEAHSVSYDVEQEESDEGWHVPRVWLEGCFATLGKQAIALVHRVEPFGGSSLLACADPLTGVTLLPVLCPVVESGWLCVPENAFLGVDASDEVYDAFLEPMTDVSDDAWPEEEENVVSTEEAFQDAEPAEESNHPAWGEAFYNRVHTSWCNGAAMIDLPRELEPIR